jgi:hypothetical protein
VRHAATLAYSLKNDVDDITRAADDDDAVDEEEDDDLSDVGVVAGLLDDANR